MPSTVPEGRNPDSTPVVHVAAAAVFDTAGRVLIARRLAHVHQGGLWEFPGGKREPDETAFAALARELHEELGITVCHARPLIQVRHDYPDKSVLLDVWRVDRFEGEPRGCEGQPLSWVKPDELADYGFPAANIPIVNAVRLPERYLITPEPSADRQAFLACLDAALLGGIRLVQLRAKTLSDREYVSLAQAVLMCCRRHGACLLINAAPSILGKVDAEGVHLTSEQLWALSERPRTTHDKWLAASCHTAAELAHATAIGVDFAVLAPVVATTTHPDAIVLGWDGFRALVAQTPMPVYALGGMTAADLPRAIEAGAQGIAAIRGFWG
jgi:8-oxo-dGTP diphosphatase